MNTQEVHRDYARGKTVGQSLRFGSWARKTIQALISIAPPLAASFDLSTLPDCDRLWIHYEAKRSPQQAALEVAGGRWR
ncbi:MAG: hypothetical protein WBR15_02955 [Gammaproteobacteria bacterium]